MASEPKPEVASSLREQAVEFIRQLRAHCDMESGDVSVQHIHDEMPQVGCGRCVNLVEAFGAVQRQVGRAEALREAAALRRYRVHVQREDPSDPLSAVEYVACPPDPNGGWVRWSDLGAALRAAGQE